MTDQAVRLRRIACEHRNQCGRPGSRLPLVIVAGGNRGVGTTSVAIRLAHALAQHGELTTLVDADFARRDATSWFVSRPRQGIVEVMTEQAPLDEVRLQVAENLQLIPATWTPNELQNNGRAISCLIDSVRKLSRDRDWIVVDVGNRVSRLHETLHDVASDLVLVSSGDEIAVMNTYAALKRLHSAGNDVASNSTVHLLLNRTNDVQHAAAVHKRFAGTAERFLDTQIQAPESFGNFDLSPPASIDDDCGRGILVLTESLLNRSAASAADNQYAKREISVKQLNKSTTSTD